MVTQHAVGCRRVNGSPEKIARWPRAEMTRLLDLETSQFGVADCHGLLWNADKNFLPR